MEGSVAVYLLDRPFIERDGVRQPPPRGRKGWALLAYLTATESTPRREWLAELLFSDAEDPLNALSWNLSQLRRLLGPDVSIGGERVDLRLPPGTFVDIRALTSGTWLRALAIPGLGHEILEGMTFPSSPAFEVWLLTERRRLAGATDDVLREAARAKLAIGDTQRAIELAGRLVAANGLDEDAQELLIRAYATAGDRAAAHRQRDACVALFRVELGVAPGPAVLHAAEATSGHGHTRRKSSRASVAARLEAGQAAMDAGAIDGAVAALRGAVEEAHATDHADLQSASLLALGSALVHGMRGRDGEGAVILHEAIAVAERIGADAGSAHAHRELGFVELLRGRYDRAHRWLRRAVSLATDHPAERAWAHAMQGVALTDVGRHADASRALLKALRLAEAADAGAAQAWALTFIGRGHLLRGELPAARDALERAAELTRRLRWTAFIPLPESLLAGVDLAEGRTEDAAAKYEHAYELSIQLGDPCWEGMAARGLGLVADRRGDREGAIRWVAEARTRCVRLPDAWLWVEAYCLDALCALAQEYGQAGAAQWIGDLEALAARTGMREMVVRAYLHRSRLGDPTAAEGARVLAADLDNPVLLAAH